MKKVIFVTKVDWKKITKREGVQIRNRPVLVHWRVILVPPK